MGVQVSRRKLLITGGAALAIPVLLNANLPAKADATSLTTSDRKVTVVSGSDNQFSSAVEALYPRLVSDPVFQKIVHLAVLVTLHSGPGIRAYSIAWAVKTPTGTYQTALFSYVSPGSAAKGFSVSTLGSARQEILRAGQSRLITPFFNWTPAYYLANPRPNWSTLLKAEEPGAFLVSESATASEVTVSLDGAVFSDWKILGPDKHNLQRRLRSKRNAEHDEALVVHRLMKKGASDSAITAALQAKGSAEKSWPSNDPQRWYEQSRRLQAQILLRAFTETDRTTFTRALTRLRLTKNTVITQATA